LGEAATTDQCCICLQGSERLSEAFTDEVLYQTAPAYGGGVRGIQTRTVEGANDEFVAAEVEDQALQLH
jgi:hypothetical protein